MQMVDGGERLHSINLTRSIQPCKPLIGNFSVLCLFSWLRRVLFEEVYCVSSTQTASSTDALASRSARNQLISAVLSKLSISRIFEKEPHSTGHIRLDTYPKRRQASHQLYNHPTTTTAITPTLSTTATSILLETGRSIFNIEFRSFWPTYRHTSVAKLVIGHRVQYNLLFT